jgi:hypothetical protein
MYLWSQYDYYDVKNNVNINEKVMLGQKWIIRNELLKIDIEPNNDISVYQNLKGNLKYLKDNIRRYGSRIKKEDDETNILDYYKDYITNNEIYLINLYNELGNDYNGTSEQTKNLYDVYIKLYFGNITNEDFNNIIHFLNSKKEYDNKNEINKIVSNISLKLFDWNYIVYTQDKLGKSTIYINGIPDKSSIQLIPNGILRQNNYLGHSLLDNTNAFAIIDEFKIYNGVLDSNIILNEYNSYLKTNTIFSNK